MPNSNEMSSRSIVSSFTTFSALTIDLLLISLLFGILLYAWSCATMSHLPLWIVVGSYVAALAYATCLSFVYTRGESTGLSPWYTVPLVILLVGLSVSGCQQIPLPGSYIKSAMILLAGYISAVTYFAKLIPLYGGANLPRSSIGPLIAWYKSDLATALELIGSMSLANPKLLIVLAVLQFLLAIFLAFCLVVERTNRPAPTPYPVVTISPANVTLRPFK